MQQSGERGVYKCIVIVETGFIHFNLPSVCDWKLDVKQQKEHAWAKLTDKGTQDGPIIINGQSFKLPF